MNPYEVLGVSENASDEEIKKRIENLSKNIIQTNTWTILFPILHLRK